jgi:hypothetical protein
LEEQAKPQILLWATPECPYRITIPAPTVNQIRILSVEAFYSVPRGGVEIGGVFFGVREPGAIHIRAHRPISCQYITGPSFTLSVKDQIGLSGLLEQALTDPDLQGMEPVGWYHSHTRSEIFLSPADLELYSEFFPERWQIAMVLRPTNLQPTRAAFFFRDRSGAVKADAPVGEFKLEPPGFGLEPIDLRARPELFPIATPAPAAAPLPASRPLSELVAEPAEPPPPPMVHIAAASGDVIPSAAFIAPPPGPVITLPPPEAIQAPEPAAPTEMNIPAFLAESKPRSRRNTGWLWALAAVALLCGAGGAAVMNWDRFAKPMDLGLETYDINGAFLIRWDRDSRAIRYAKRAALEIQDGSERTPIELTPGELALGGYGYMRRTGQVSVHMKVEGATPAEEFSNFNSSQSLGSEQPPAPDKESGLAQATKEREHLKTELINESMQSLELRREVTSLRRQLAEERARNSR